MNEKMTCMRCKIEMEEELYRYSNFCLPCGEKVTDKWNAFNEWKDKKLDEINEFQLGKRDEVDIP